MHGSHASTSSSNANGVSPGGAVINGSEPRFSKSGAAGTNGIANGNGAVHANGTFPRQLLQHRGHNRQELVRLLMQTAQDLGLSNSAQALENESGIELESPSVAALRASVESGEWEEAEQLLLGSEDLDGESSAHARHLYGLPLKPGTNRRELRFMIRQQKYLELLEIRDHARALMVLRSELTPLSQDTEHLHFLSGLMVSPTAADVKEQADWDGAHEGSRQMLLQTLSNFIHHSVMIPPNRLTNLLDQVKKVWITNCDWHNPVEPLSLFVDHQCDREEFPLHTVHTIQQVDEIWYIEFSHNGRCLATCGRDKAVIVYEVGGEWEERYRLEGHTASVAYVTWSPNDQWLVTCSRDKSAKLWNAATGECVTTIHKHAEPVTSAAWLPDSSGFCTGSLDASSPLNKWLISDLQQRKNTQPAHTFLTNFRVQDIAITSDGQRVAAISADHERSRLVVYNLFTHEQEYSINFQCALTCVRASRDGRHLLLNLSNNELQCLNVVSRTIVQRYQGQKQGRFVIRSAWGGADENLVLSGSQDGKVYVFHRGRGSLIDTLPGHRMTATQDDGERTGCVNAITWNLANPCMFASSGDDKTVRIWSKGSYTPATTRRSSSDGSLLYASHPSLPGAETTEPSGSSRHHYRYPHGASSAATALL